MGEMGGFPEMPEGPVTIMFTDIEGSTALRTTRRRRRGRRRSSACTTTSSGAEIEAHKGHDQEAALGDGFLAVFVSPRRAVACAIGIQQALDTFNRSRAGALAAACASGSTPARSPGRTVSRRAKPCTPPPGSAPPATGGQIFVSDVTRQLAGTVPDVTFHDAGEFELKGFPQPWRLWDVVWVRETTRAPASRSSSGREPEMAQLRGQAARGPRRAAAGSCSSAASPASARPRS